MPFNPEKIGIIGNGNVSWHLCRLFSKHIGCSIIVYVRNPQMSPHPFHPLCRYECDIKIFTQHPFDLVFLCVNDTAIPAVAKQLPTYSLIINTSGIFPAEKFKELDFSRYGSFYPFQSLKKNILPREEKFPVCIEASDSETEKKLHELAVKIHLLPLSVTKEQKEILHLAGVLVNNFNNYLLGQAVDLLEKNHLSKELLLPLALETVHRIASGHPRNFQTGPAIRNDQQTLARHIELISDENMRQLYRLFSEMIRKQQH